jgi:DNA-binding NarL/FixJ family response regulator
MDKKIKIIVVDDHEIFRKGLIMVLSKLQNFEIIDEASDGIEFLDILSRKVPDIVLIDIEMPKMNGIDATIKALELFPDLKIVALSMYGEETYLHKIIDAGAVGFMLKNISRDDLERAIRKIYEGKNYYSEELLSFFTKKYIKSDKNTDDNTKLTKREIEVLQLIAKGLTDNEIAEQLFLSQRTINSHRASLLLKTGSKNTVNLLVYAIKNKLVEI